MEVIQSVINVGRAFAETGVPSVHAIVILAPGWHPGHSLATSRRSIAHCIPRATPLLRVAERWTRIERLSFLDGYKFLEGIDRRLREYLTEKHKKGSNCFPSPSVVR